MSPTQIKEDDLKVYFAASSPCRSLWTSSIGQGLVAMVALGADGYCVVGLVAKVLAGS